MVTCEACNPCLATGLEAAVFVSPGVCFIMYVRICAYSAHSFEHMALLWHSIPGGCDVQYPALLPQSVSYRVPLHVVYRTGQRFRLDTIEDGRLHMRNRGCLWKKTLRHEAAGKHTLPEL